MQFSVLLLLTTFFYCRDVVMYFVGSRPRKKARTYLTPAAHPQYLNDNDHNGSQTVL